MLTVLVDLHLLSAITPLLMAKQTPLQLAMALTLPMDRSALTVAILLPVFQSPQRCRRLASAL